MSYGGIGHPWAQGIRLHLVAKATCAHCIYFVVLPINALVPSVELACDNPSKLLQIEGVFRLEGALISVPRK